MPFQSEKQRRFLHANHPEIAKRWERDYANGGISQLVQPGPGRPGYRGDAAYASESEQSAQSRGGQGQTAEVRTDTGPRDYGETWGYVPPPKKKIIKTDDKEPPIKKKKKKKNIIEDTLKTIGSKIGIHPLLNRRLHYNMALKLPGSKDRVKNYRKKYKEYLDKIGAKSPSTLGDKDLFSFWQSDAFNYQPSTGMDYGAFLIDKYDNPTVTMGGDVGNFYAMEKPDWFDGSDREWETKKRDIIENRGYSMGEGDGQIPLWMELGFNSEDEYLASLADGGVARKNYFHGGVLDINESEEIISDDGNDIELTAYNAEFDDPNDLSTGVKTLFQAKDGGGDFDVKKKYKKSNLVTAPHYWKSAPDHPGTELAYITKPEKDLLLKADLHNSLNGKPNKGPAGIISLNGWESDFSSDWGGEAAPQGAGHENEFAGISVWKDVDTGDASIAEDIAAKERKRQQELKDLIARGDEEKYDTEKQMISDKWTHDTVAGETKRGRYKIDRDTQLYEKALADQKAKLRKMGKGKLGGLGIMLLTLLVGGVSLGDALKYLPKGISLSKEDLSTIVKNSIPVMQAKNNLKKTIGEVKEKYKELGMAEFHHAVDTEIQTIDQQLLDLTKKRDDDDTGDGGPEVPQVVPVHEEIQEYEDTYAMSPWERIKANQAKRALLVDKGIIRDNPIVDESVTDINMEPNKGGLANLFRVKNQ